MLRELRGAVREGDLVGVFTPPGPAWLDILDVCWAARAAVFPTDVRLAPIEAANLLGRARPTVFVTHKDVHRRDAGVPVDPGTALVVATSGTSGRFQLAELAHEALAAAVGSSSAALDARAEDAWLCCLPVAHIGGLLVVARHLLLGAPVIVRRSFTAGPFRRRGAFRFTSLVPTQLARLINDEANDLSGFKAILVGGSALPDELAARARHAGACVVPTYGLTESCGGVVYSGTPLRGVEVRADGGELLLRGPTLMRGYRLDPEATAAVLTEDGWLRTGDAGHIDGSGIVSVSGRVADVIVSGGENVWPAEVEAALAGHPEVAEVAVAGRDDPEWGERVVAFVVPRRRGSPPTLDSLRDFAAQSIARFKAPREVVIVETLDRNILGKVRSSALQ
jgi:O-succinylbenzoic acid--CoA ligase